MADSIPHDAPASAPVDLLILVDATASMGSYLTSLRQSLPQIISISALTNCFERIGLLAYRDYTDKDLLEWSGWKHCGGSEGADDTDLVARASQLKATGGGDYPEAAKTGLARAYELMRADAKTLILLYADAPPHMEADLDNGYSNGKLERDALMKPQSYGGYGQHFEDWVSAAQMLRNGPKKAQVIPILQLHQERDAAVYDYLAIVTHGAAIHLVNAQPRNISEVTVEVLLAWMGVKKEGVPDVSLQAKMSWYDERDELDRVRSESQLSGLGRFHNLIASQRLQLNTKTLEERLPKKAVPIANFAKMYQKDARYRSMVMAQLRAIIMLDVSAISLNPVFGSLWRTVCNDRENDERQALLDLFGNQVNSIGNPDEQAKMKTWLAESYDYTAEVLEVIGSVPENLRFPCVYLDPTLSYRGNEDSDSVDKDDSNKPITSFRRDELLELGRSCDYRILRRLGRVLTRLTIIDSPEAVPNYITAAEDVIRIPLALASEEHGRKFWKILLHIVVPGTMLSGRASALLAALAIRIGVQPLRDAAEAQMMLWRDKWNDIEVPETWNVSCLALLLDADKAYCEESSHAKSSSDDGLLQDRDRQLFERLVDYKMLELNLDTTLHAKVSWSPAKTSMPIGPITKCRTCQYPRSVTVMGPESVCGLCCFNRDNAELAADDLAELGKRVSKEDNEASQAYWCECSVTTCRAQYVVYDMERLNVRAKCHYCRAGQEAPLLECRTCLSRMIWPEEYRSAGSPAFQCVGCTSNRPTVVAIETTTNRLKAENGQNWLLTNEGHKIKDALLGRSLFYTASNALPLDDFCERVAILPGRAKSHEHRLTFNGKPIQNVREVLEALYAWIHKRGTENGTCSLCFSNIRKNALAPACGRSGCKQQICADCLTGWYGLNTAGRLINTAALHCPFCRRTPTHKTLSRLGTGVHAVARLQEAVAESGQWIYAWCAECGHAKQYMERVCADGAPPYIEGWTCDECRDARGNAVKTRKCPGCGMETEKTSGCDHIQCAVPGCGVHWCFFCGEKHGEGEIYAHMNDEHGGYYGGRETDGEEEEDG